MLKRLLPLLLIVLAMFYGAPRQACVCSDGAQYSKPATHSCCKEEARRDCISDSHDIGTRSACCGMTGNKFSIGLAGSIVLLPDSNQKVEKVMFPDWLANVNVSTRSERVLQLNRAPPHIAGMGTSKTYLHKRTFLI